ncbi:uncharacterized protein LOC127010920 [Drosophila biarmipes]|uniref:uncharacterized protein LOC127010920 n=1 Tax=Drosophila biarmipes TaxID=125945 RepID=UPI0021CCED71|nr:uncharacterized protein LOC127010920 [Drosophila biarmipes]
MEHTKIIIIIGNSKENLESADNNNQKFGKKKPKNIFIDRNSELPTSVSFCFMPRTRPVQGRLRPLPISPPYHLYSSQSVDLEPQIWSSAISMPISRDALGTPQSIDSELAFWLRFFVY